MYTENSEYCNFGREMMTESWLCHMYRLTGLMKYASRKNYNDYYRNLVESGRAHSKPDFLVAA